MRKKSGIGLHLLPAFLDNPRYCESVNADSLGTSYYGRCNVNNVPEEVYQ